MSNNVTLRQLRAFCAVVEAGSFTGAAKSLYLSQAALSGLMKELESQVGVRLLDRSTRHVSPSTVGEWFFPLAKRVLDDLDDALLNINNLKELRRGAVRVAAPEVLSCTLMPELIAEYGDRYPEIDVKFYDIPIESVFSRLSSGEIDLGIAPVTEPTAEFDAVILMKTPLCAAFSPDSSLARNEQLTWKDLQFERLITFLPEFSRRVLSKVPNKHHPRNISEVRRLNTALSMIRTRPGVTICPAFAGPFVEGFGLTFKPLIKPLIYLETLAFTRKGVALSPAAENFLAFTRDYSATWLERQQ